MPSKPEARIQELRLTLPTPPKPMAKYRPALQVGNLLYVSGHGPFQADGKLTVGRVGADLSLEQGKEAARLVGLNVLSTVRNTLGSLDRVRRLVKTLGMVNCTADFKEQPQVINGFSELMAEVFGEEAGVGARSAVGMGSLPGNIPVEVECVFEVM
ncbi:MAG TPA: RidA family protein [Gemmataceae bacterium]|nr:RidA family protein [Gemmataceae bacterium]